MKNLHLVSAIVVSRTFLSKFQPIFQFYSQSVGDLIITVTEVVITIQRPPFAEHLFCHKRADLDSSNYGLEHHHKILFWDFDVQ